MLGLDIEKPGDVYLVRRTNTLYNRLPEKCKIIGFEYSTELVCTREEAMRDVQKVYMSVLKKLHETPIVVSDSKILTNLLKFGPCLTVYCDPAVHG